MRSALRTDASSAASSDGASGSSSHRLNADSRGFVPSHVRGLFDTPLPVFSFSPEELPDSGHAVGLRLDGDSRVALSSVFPLLSRQLPADALTWPSLNDGLSESRLLLDAVLSATAYPVTSLTPNQYAEHSVALLAAEIASSRAEVSSYDLHVSSPDPE